MRRALAATVSPLALVFLAGCSGEGATPSESVHFPSPARFDLVARTLDAHCGTLDCHGAIGRNLRLFGWSGRRFDPKDLPGGAPTTAAEAGVDYCALVAVEPELLSAVADDGGEHPERLTFVRKARGTEHHTGGTVFPEGSAGDRCLVAWIAERTEDVETACPRSLDDLSDEPPETKGTVDLSACAGPAESLQ